MVGVSVGDKGKGTSERKLVARKEGAERSLKREEASILQ